MKRHWIILFVATSLVAAAELGCMDEEEVERSSWGDSSLERLMSTRAIIDHVVAAATSIDSVREDRTEISRVIVDSQSPPDYAPKALHEVRIVVGPDWYSKVQPEAKSGSSLERDSGPATGLAWETLYYHGNFFMRPAAVAGRWKGSSTPGSSVASPT